MEGKGGGEELGGVEGGETNKDIFLRKESKFYKRGKIYDLKQAIE